MTKNYPKIIFKTSHLQEGEIDTSQPYTFLPFDPPNVLTNDMICLQGIKGLLVREPELFKHLELTLPSQRTLANPIIRTIPETSLQYKMINARYVRACKISDLYGPRLADFYFDGEEMHWITSMNSSHDGAMSRIWCDDKGESHSNDGFPANSNRYFIWITMSRNNNGWSRRSESASDTHIQLTELDKFNGLHPVTSSRNVLYNYVKARAQLGSPASTVDQPTRQVPSPLLADQFNDIRTDPRVEGIKLEHGSIYVKTHELLCNDRVTANNYRIGKITFRVTRDGSIYLHKFSKRRAFQYQDSIYMVAPSLFVVKNEWSSNWRDAETILVLGQHTEKYASYIAELQYNKAIRMILDIITKCNNDAPGYHALNKWKKAAKNPRKKVSKK